MKAFAIDFGGTHATCGIVEDRTLLAHSTIDTGKAKSLAAVLPQIESTFHQLVKSQSLSLANLAGVAVGFAALVALAQVEFFRQTASTTTQKR